jgi:hypothetical protein|nr:MAG TPA_asm: hypothetical protein [Caudoviricetes sp.]
MSRLIDADELKERFCEENCGKNRCVDHMDKCAWILSVEESKTAFDVDKVVEQLDTYITKLVGRNAALYKTVMQIVKGGGAE